MIKKIILSLLIGSLCNLNAQDFKPLKGGWTTQVGMALTANAPNVISLGFNGRHFMKDRLAFRLSVISLNTKEVTNFAENPDGSGAKGKFTEKTRVNSLLIGIEKHCLGNRRLSPYFGFELGYGGGKVLSDGENADAFGFENSYTYKSSLGIRQAVFAGFMGFDYWITEGIYLGIEYAPFTLNLTFLSDEVEEETQFGQTVKEVIPKSSYSEFTTLNAFPVFRLGWRLK